jgi:lipoprotein-anchoring transpeptidase ErfK/SrfK
MARAVSAKTRRRGARRPQGRRRLWLGVLLGVLAVIGVALALYPYPPLPTAEVEAARKAFQEARRDAADLAPGPLNKAAASATLMERLYAYDRSRWVRFTRVEALDEAISQTRAFAAQALSEAAQLRSNRLNDGDRQRRQLESELASLEPDIKFLPPRERGARGAYARAELALAQAADAQRDGDLGRLDTSLKAAQTELELTRKTLDTRYQRFRNPEWRRRWQGWADTAVAASRGGKVAIVVDKMDRRLYLLRDGRVAATFEADLGRNALSGKATAGDGATPEGRYHITEKRSNGATRWYKALVLNYPNAEDQKAFEAMRRRGEIPRGRGPGSLIEIHGFGGKQSNWTDGCVALQNASMDRLFAQVPVGTPVAIVGAARLPGGGDAESSPR